MVEPEEYVYFEDEARTVIRVDFSLHAGMVVAAQERVALVYQAFALAETVDHAVTLLLDLRERVTLHPANWLTLIWQMIEDRPANVMRVLVVGSQRAAIYQRVLAVLGRLLQGLPEIHFMEGLEDALVLLDSPGAAGRDSMAGRG